MKYFIREIPLERLTDKIVKDLEDQGFTLEYKIDSVEVWIKD